LSNDVCSFETEAAMNAALKQVWIEYVKEKVAEGEMAKDGIGELHDDLEGMSDEVIGDLKICGHMKGQVVIDNGTTVAYTQGGKAYGLDKWFFFKPPDKYLVNATGYQVEQYNIEWASPEA